MVLAFVHTVADNEKKILDLACVIASQAEPAVAAEMCRIGLWDSVDVGDFDIRSAARHARRQMRMRLSMSSPEERVFGGIFDSFAEP